MADSNIRTAVEVNGVPLSCFGWPADTAACGTYRLLFPLRTLSQRYGIQTEVSATSTLPFTILIAQRTHGVQQTDFLKKLIESRKLYNRRSIPKLVYELDDDLWNVPKDNPAHEYYENKGIRKREQECIEISDMVTVSTEPLAKIMRQFNDNVVVLPNSIPRKLTNEIAYPYTTGSPDKPYVIAWAGSASHLQDFRVCADSVSSYLRLNPNTRMVFFGTDYSWMLHPSVHSQCRQAPWVSSVPEYHSILHRAQIDVMLAPLAANTFNESKSNLRLIEALGLGIPVIASNTGPYAGDTPGVTSVELGDSWVPALSAMSHPFARLEQSSVGREWVKENFTIEKNVTMWKTAYEDVLSS